MTDFRLDSEKLEAAHKILANLEGMVELGVTTVSPLPLAKALREALGDDPQVVERDCAHRHCDQKIIQDDDGDWVHVGGRSYCDSGHDTVAWNGVD